MLSIYIVSDNQIDSFQFYFRNITINNIENFGKKGSNE